MEQVYARDIYGKTLVELGKDHNDIVVCDADLSGSTRTCFFAKEFPERFFNFGVAEQNMMATAAGLASCGKVVFVSTFAMFATARVLDQIRNTICHNNLNVKIAATHAGITVGEDGATHQALEDVSILRAIPNMKIVVPCDGPEAREAVIAAYKFEGPFYIRLGRSKVETLSHRPPFELGKGYILEEGKDLAIISCGILVNEALKARDILKEKNIDAAVVGMPTIKPVDSELLVKLAEKYQKILVCEEHSTRGGLFSEVCEVLSRRLPIKINAVGVEDRFGQSGSPKELLDFYELSAPFIARKAESLLGQRN